MFKSFTSKKDLHFQKRAAIWQAKVCTSGQTLTWLFLTILLRTHTLQTNLSVCMLHKNGPRCGSGPESSVVWEVTDTLNSGYKEANILLLHKLLLHITKYKISGSIRLLINMILRRHEQYIWCRKYKQKQCWCQSFGLFKKKKHGLKTVKSIIGQEDYSVSTVNVHLFTVIMRNKTTTSRVSEIQLKRSLRFLSMFVEIVWDFVWLKNILNFKKKKNYMLF